MNPMFAQQWLSREAASIEAMNKAGTFRRALWQYLECKVAPLFGLLLAYADADDNLDLLYSARPMIRNLWLAMFEDPELTSVRYERLQSAMRGTELPELVVQHHLHTAGDRLYQAVFPFSWVVRDMVDALLQQAHTSSKAVSHQVHEEEEDQQQTGNWQIWHNI